MTNEPPIVHRALGFTDRVAISNDIGEFSYGELREGSHRAASRLLRHRGDLAGARVAFLVPPSFEYAATQWGIWRAGGVAVPLCLAHPRPELEYVVQDCGAEFLIGSATTTERLHPIARDRGIELITSESMTGGEPGSLPSIESERPAMLVYTSGTTGGPKGVVTTHTNIAAQITSLVEAWEWSENDRIPLVLPLHHVHGIINILGCALWSGARCDMAARFDPVETWARFVETKPSLFMAVPTIYAKLARAWQDAPSEQQEKWSNACGHFRLMVSGSAALPMRLFELWQQISGHTLLERYGMTEIGMALSNPLRGERRPGHVGHPLPGVEVRRVDAEGGSRRRRRCLARSRYGDSECFWSIGSDREETEARFGTAGFEPETSPSSRRARTGSSAAAVSTSSRPAATRSRPSRSRRRCGSTQQFESAQSLESTMRSGANESRWLSSLRSMET